MATRDAAFLAGCDGAHSRVRETLSVGFGGGTYQHLFYVADVDARGPVMNGEVHVALDRTDFVAVFPLTSQPRAGSLAPSAREPPEGGTT
jgi:2-polyprenyl-6-methoxyphenol hydroxylase-like FAD-dependent oxidoreductase